jgi:xyloglucan-specific exo-beta-1,4-glucanase
MLSDIPLSKAFVLAILVCLPIVHAASQSYTWKNVKIGGGGGFVDGIVFNPSQQGLAYARTDIGGAYRLNSDDSWTPLLDWVDSTNWNNWGVDAIATDPINTNKLYMATGLYTNSWDPSNGQILISSDKGATFTTVKVPFKVGGNMPGRGMGERLVVDPNNNNVLFFGTRSGNGLWKSTNAGVTWTKVSSFPSVGTYRPDPSDTSGYNSDIIGLSFVTFDSTSATKGTTTPRIFVGVANAGSNNLFVTNDGGTTWSAVAGQNNTFIPHKGVLSPSDKNLYISYSNGAGPYDGTLGAVWRYSIATSTWTDITPSKDNLYFGFGGLAVDLKKPGTIMVAAVNSWWPDGQIFRSTDSGSTWSPLWAWNPYPTLQKFYAYDDSLAPWLGPGYTLTTEELQIGWMMEALAIDPFDSNHWLYGTGATIYGGHDLAKWDTTHNVTLKSLADGIEQTAVLGLVSLPSGGPRLISALGDIQGFVHTSLTSPPTHSWTNPEWSTTADLDWAGNKPSNLVRIGTGDSTQGKQLALSTDSGSSWYQHYGAADNVNGGRVAISADADTVLWSTSSSGVQVSTSQATFSSVTSLPATAVIASDKKTNSLFYASYAGKFYVSTDTAKTFTSKVTLGSSTASNYIAVNPNTAGDIWVSTDKGLFHSTNNGNSFTAIAGIAAAWRIALGAPAKSGGYPAVYAAATISGTSTLFRSDDAGANWIQISDAKHGFALASSMILAADLTIYGRVYVGTNGRGIFYGDVAGAAPPPTTTVTTTSQTITTTTTSQTITSTTTTAPPSSQTAPVYGQCGGTNWSGPTVCATGSTCTYSNDFYSQCIPK